MARRTLDSRPTVRSEGGLLPPELLDRITDPREKDLPGLDPARDYGLEANLRLTEAAARSWEHAKAYWGAFKARLEGSRPGAELGITRQQWLVPLLAELGYDDLDYRQQAEEVNGRPFHISHRATSEDAAPPLHLVAASQPLDKADPSAPGPKASPHGFLQSYLNETDHLWGIVSNGRQLRVLRDNASLTRPAYLEFDLEGMMEGGVFADFTLLWMVAHRSRLPKGTGDTDACFLEQWYKAALVRGARALGDLRLGVENAIRALGRGFLDHPENEALREKLSVGDLDDVGYYRQLLRVVYRLLFLLVAEERDLLFPTGAEPRGREIYNEHYSVSRLRERLRLDRGDNRHDDLWRAQRVAFDLVRAGNANLGLPALGGGIFDVRMAPDLEAAQLGNDALKAAIRGLSLAPTKSGYRRINYRDLDVEELGSVYESLLDEQPSLRTDGGHLRFELTKSGSRKESGSYYTPSVLVQELIRSALDPVIQQALASAPDIEGKRSALLDLAVCDPACGSGHFLLAAARRIGRELAQLASGEHEPDPGVLRHHIREAITHCVHGVDLNPLAVDLCRLALWLEGHEPGRPLGFLDHRIKLGNSLVGATTELIEKGIPTEAFEPVEGDNKDVAKVIKKQNRQELEKPQLRLFESTGLEAAGPTLAEAKEARTIADFEEDAPDDVLLKEEEHAEFEARLAHKKRAADLWVAAFFWPLQDEAPSPPTQSTLLHHRAGREQEMGTAFEKQLQRVVDEVRPFHWELEFPDVFARKGGFDCMLGNPPYLNAMQQKSLGMRKHKSFWDVRFSSSRGAYDIYILFLELVSDLTAAAGRAALLTPNKYLSAPYAEALREHLDSESILLEVADVSRTAPFDDVSVYPLISTLAGSSIPREWPVVSRLPRSTSGFEAFRHDRAFLHEIPDYNWGILLSRAGHIVQRIISHTSTLGVLLEVNASTTAAESDAYSRSVITSSKLVTSAKAWRLLNTGLIDKYVSLWDSRTLRSNKQEFDKPMLVDSPLISDRRKAQYSSSKIIFAKLALHIEAFYDASGIYAALNTNFAFTDGDAGYFYLAQLNADVSTWLYRQMFGALSMGGDYLQFQAPQIKAMRVVPYDEDDPRHRRLVEISKQASTGSQAARALAEVDRIVAALFGLSPEDVEALSAVVPTTGGGEVPDE